MGESPSKSSVAAEVLHEKFERQASQTPEAIALVCNHQRMTYAELDHRSNQLARLLRTRGIGRGQTVGLLLERSMEVYVALLGILKAGAAYVPLDPDYPPDRVCFILTDCAASALIISSCLVAKAEAFAGQMLSLPEIELEMSRLPAERPPEAERGVSATDLCYIIYTSGTTGRPKGVAIEHRSACHLVETERAIFQIQPKDRVYQGFSIAFDASIEEIWLAFCAGATLVVGTEDMVRGGPTLADMLAESGVTVLSCVPTLLAMMDQDVPSVRLLILGGEACSAEMLKRWWKPGRRIVNTYGPTEATVVATYAECHRGQPITIGQPLPGYQVAILDDQLQPMPAGAAGELCLGGIGLARGYIGRPDLTNERFVSVSIAQNAPQRFYRTGDLVRWSAGGMLEFLGRIDSQVKIRGFRVELSEIETVLIQQSEVKAAAVALREDHPGLQQLVAYVVPREGVQANPELLRGSLRAQLPPYMIPAVIEMLPRLPTLPSGKLDRKALPPPCTTSVPKKREPKPPRTPAEKQLAALWKELFAASNISIEDDFFVDLGGHSLLAARAVSALRRTSPFEQLSIIDLYHYPKIESLAAEVDRRSTHHAPESTVSASPQLVQPLAPIGNQQQALARDYPAASIQHPASPIHPWRHFLCGAAQLVTLVFVLTFFALQWLAPYLTYTVLVEEEYGFVTAVLGAFASLVLLYPIMLAVPIAVKWIVIGRYRVGSYPLWGRYYFRWWLVRTVESVIPVGYLKGTALYRVYLRLMGARIGNNVQLHTDALGTYDLLAIGDDSSINADSKLLGYTVENGLLHIGSITIGRRCFVGARAAICENTTMADDSALEDLSLLQRGERIPAGETWSGSPAVKQPLSGPNGHSRELNGERKPCDAATSQRWNSPGGVAAPLNVAGLAERRPPHRYVLGLLQGVGLLLFPVLVVAALFPGIILMNRLNYIDPYYWYLLLSPLVAASFIVLLCLEIAAVKWLLLGKIKPGWYPVNSFFYLRKWFVDQTMELSLDVLGPLYASVYLTPWYKLLGAKLGAGAEISTASFISPDLLSIGSESFIADSVSLGAARVRNGFMFIGKNHIGKRSFIGNSALLPPDTVIGNSVLIGCLSAPPDDPAQAIREDSAWLGSPSVFLPQRQHTAAFDEQTTFNPSTKLRVQRATIEFIRVITPSTCFIILTSLLFSSLLLLHDHYSLGQTLLFFPLLYAACGVAAALFTIAAKWLLVGRYRPCEKPLWSTFVWRNELLNALHEHLAEPFLIGTLIGTPFLPWYFRLLGARIGRRVYCGTTDFSEFDLAQIGDDTALNADCTIQTHLFEDRVMKMSHVKIASGCSVGAGSLVLYDTCMEAGACLGPLSLLMKGETLPAGTRWEGIPARKDYGTTGLRTTGLRDYGTTGLQDCRTVERLR